jgi:hypothetical protein
MSTQTTPVGDQDKGDEEEEEDLGLKIFVFNSCPPDAALRIWKSDPTVLDTKMERGLPKRIQDLTVQETGLDLRIFKLFLISSGLACSRPSF